MPKRKLINDVYEISDELEVENAERLFTHIKNWLPTDTYEEMLIDYIVDNDMEEEYLEGCYD